MRTALGWNAGTNLLGMHERDLFAFGKGQVAPRKRRQVGRWRAAILAEPPRSNRLRYAGVERPENLVGRFQLEVLAL